MKNYDRAAGSRSNCHLSSLSTTVMAGLLVVGGCEQPTQPSAPRSTAARVSRTDYLSKAVDFIKRLDEFERGQATLQATYQLNRWIAEQTPPADWKPDPMVATLPREIREGSAIERLDDRSFRLEDVNAVIEAVWMRDISNWVSSRGDPGPLSVDLAEQAKSLGPAAGDQLTIAYRLFDWTIRGIELEELLDYPADPLTVGTEVTRQLAIPAPQRRVAGPGYQLRPWQVLLYGKGDSLLRARVFIALSRQQGIPVVMLAFPGLTSPPRPRPWLAAAVIDQQLYLFDTQLGLPIPGPAGTAVATLEDVLEDASLLEYLRVGDEFDYEIAARDLNRIIALIDASAAALSLKSRLVEENLSGADRLRLTVNASQLQQRLAALLGINEVSLWALPYEAAWYQEAIAEGIKTDKNLDAEQYLKYGVFQARTAIVRARYAHFQGQFDNQGDEKGAKNLYLESRMSNKQIDQLDTNEEVQKYFGVSREKGEHELSFLNRIAGTKMMVRQAKVHASYWLGLAQYDSGHPAAAEEWLDRTINSFSDGSVPGGSVPDGMWTAGARYNLARAKEAQGKLEEARELYLSDKSPQQHGNVLRARLLRKHLTAEAAQ